MVAAENAAIARREKEQQGQVDLALYIDSHNRHTWDIEIIDENGRVVWARDLADRYRKELNYRQQRDYKERDNKKPNDGWRPGQCKYPNSGYEPWRRRTR